ncbi:hypothetical protein BOTNAR_0290g00100 [Botryotinia narcissicola]|uniref:Uncharacterized protein n=1 Tax=Botryotinia narcissicola TaxID=278944 RepID=A0A4Z1HWP7_9HELO|nr:hypothetical protein BOTNAR_0290g00100 [Botryotinia narcissicola]
MSSLGGEGGEVGGGFGLVELMNAEIPRKKSVLVGEKYNSEIMREKEGLESYKIEVWIQVIVCVH